MYQVVEKLEHGGQHRPKICGECLWRVNDTVTSSGAEGRSSVVAVVMMQVLVGCDESGRDGVGEENRPAGDTAPCKCRH
jgi:hypothetical protein